MAFWRRPRRSTPPASPANGSDDMPTPVDYFRHRPTAHRVLKGTVDLPSFIEPLDPSRHFWCGAGPLPERNANCLAVPSVLGA